jgi:hypothetical protein
MLFEVAPDAVKQIAVPKGLNMHKLFAFRNSYAYIGCYAWFLDQHDTGTRELNPH